MKAAVVVGLLFFASAIWNFAAHDGDASDGFVGLAVSTILLGFHAYVARDGKKEEEFLAWLVRNRDAIRTVGASYHGIPITLDTLLVRYQGALSCLLYSFKASSRSYIVGHHSAVLTSSVFSGFSLVFGWWGLPWGPAFTVQAVSNNLSRSAWRSVGEILRGLPLPPVPSSSSTGAPVLPHVGV